MTTSQVKPAELTTLRLRPAQTAVIAACAFALQAAAQAPDCAANPRNPACKLDTALHMLYWLAGGLACLLAAVVLLAVIIYRRNKAARLLRDE